MSKILAGVTSVLLALLPFASATTESAEQPESVEESEQPEELELSFVSDGVLTIGTLFNGYGTADRAAQAQVAAVELAVRDIVQAGGLPNLSIITHHRNPGNNVESLEAAFASLQELGVDIIIGPGSQELMLPLSHLLEHSGLSAVSAAANNPWQRLQPDTAPFSLWHAPSTAAHQVLGELAAAGRQNILFAYLPDETGVALLKALESRLPELPDDDGETADPDAEQPEDEQAEAGVEDDAEAAESSGEADTVEGSTEAPEAGVTEGSEPETQFEIPETYPVKAFRSVSLATLNPSQLAADAMTIAAGPADAVVLWLPERFRELRAEFLTELVTVGVAAESIVLIDHSRSVDTSLAAVTELQGLRSVLLGSTASETFAARLKQSDPWLRTTIGTVEVYEAVTAVALAALIMGTDDPAQLRGGAPAVTGWYSCGSYSECAHAINDGVQVQYRGPSGTLPLRGEGSGGDASLWSIQEDASWMLLTREVVERN